MGNYKLTEEEYKERMAEIIQYTEYQPGDQKLAKMAYDNNFQARHTKNTDLKYVEWDDLTEEERGIWCFTAGCFINDAAEAGYIEDLRDHADDC